MNDVEPMDDPGGMDDFERELREAMQRQPAPPSLKRKVMGRLWDRAQTCAPSRGLVAAAGCFSGVGGRGGRGSDMAQRGRKTQRRRSQTAGIHGLAHYQPRTA